MKNEYKIKAPFGGWGMSLSPLRGFRGLSIIFLISCTLLLTSCKKGGPPPGMGNNMDRPIPVELHTISQEIIEDSDKYIATIEAPKSINIYSRVNTYIKDIHVNSGQQVAQGQLLFSLESSNELAQVNNQQANLQKAQSQYKLAQGQYQRYKKLYKKELISKEELDNQYNNYIVAKTAVDTSQAQLQSAQAQLAYTQITAPFGGIIGDVLTKKGNYVTPLALLTTLSDISKLEIKLNIPASKISKVNKGDNVSLFNNGELTGTGKITFISPVVDNTTQTILIKAIYNNNSRLLRTGQLIQTEIIYNKHKVIALPNHAIKRQGGNKFVYIVEHNADGELVAKLQPITTDTIKNNKYIIKTGLEEGDIIVWSGSHKIFMPEAKVIDIEELQKETEK